jgi:hypothetical protein
LPRSHLCAVPCLVSVPCLTPDNVFYVALGIVAWSPKRQPVHLLYLTPPDACCRVFVAGGYLLPTFAPAEAQQAVQERLEATKVPGKRGAFPNNRV